MTLKIDATDIPPPLMTSEVGSFAWKTIVERKPQIIQRVIADNDYPRCIVDALHQFAEEITSQRVTALTDAEANPDFWNTHWSQYADRTWLELPWYFAETYFYMRLLEITGYFTSGTFYHSDPFLAQKIAQENTALNQLALNWAAVEQTPVEERFTFLLHAALWGNRADLSNFTVKEMAQHGVGTQSLRRNILIDDTDYVQDMLKSGVRETAFINDNVGADSISDLFLADFLLEEEWVHTVSFHLKNQPFFVSDAMPADILRVIEKMQDTPGPLQRLGTRLSNYVQDGQLQLLSDPFWVSCLSFWQLTPGIKEHLTRVDLTILKGDVNYRRLLDDRHWDPTTKVEAIAKDFPKPFLILRTLKGEIIAGLENGHAEKLAEQDPTWLINGKRGIIQLINTV
jgi:hypothetical protein